MVYIEQYDSTRSFITTMSNAQIAKLKEEQGLPVSRFHNPAADDEAQHWIAEPSALAAIENYAEEHGHLFSRVVMTV
jgi:hypothetical protein